MRYLEFWLNSRTLPCLEGELKVRDPINEYSDIQQYICSNEKGLYLVKLYKFQEFFEACQNEIKFLLDLEQESFYVVDSYFNNESAVLILKIKDCTTQCLKLLNSPLQNKTEIVQSLVSLIANLHRKEVFHSCIKPENIFLTGSGEVKIIGFENAVCLKNKENELTDSQFVFQSLRLKSPELLGNEYEIGIASDIWSLGCVIYNIFTEHEPFESIEGQVKGLFQRLADQKLDNIFEKVFSVDPVFRPNAESLKTMIDREMKIYKLSLFDKIFYRTCNQMVEWAGRDSESAPKDRVLEKLEKRSKKGGDKVYKAINKLDLAKERVALKGLILVHYYWMNGKTENMVSEKYDLLEKIENSLNPESEDTAFIISDYLNLLKKKRDFHKQNRISCNWDCFYLDYVIDTELYNYLSAVTDLTRKILKEETHLKIYQVISQLALTEYIKLYSIINKNSLVFASFLLTFCKNTASIVQEIYNKFPFIFLPLHSLVPIVVRSNLPTNLIPREPSSDLSYQRLSEFSVESLPDIEILEVIGEGSSSTVHKGKYRGADVAIKLIKEKFLIEFKRELSILTIIDHPNIVKYIGTCNSSNRCVVTELCTGGPLDQVLRTHKNKISPRQKVKIALDIARGMLYLHSQHPPIIHRDLKSLNILLAQKFERGKPPLAKITDFGISRTVNDERMTLKMGTVLWMAPEVLKGFHYGTPCDVFSYGVVLWEIACGRYPSRRQKNFLDLDAKASEATPSVLKELIKECSNEDPALRPLFENIVQRLESN